MQWEETQSEHDVEDSHFSFGDNLKFLLCLNIGFPKLLEMWHIVLFDFIPLSVHKLLLECVNWWGKESMMSLRTSGRNQALLRILRDCRRYHLRHSSIFCLSHWKDTCKSPLHRIKKQKVSEIVTKEGCRLISRF